MNTNHHAKGNLLATIAIFFSLTLVSIFHYSCRHSERTDEIKDTFITVEFNCGKSQKIIDDQVVSLFRSAEYDSARLLLLPMLELKDKCSTAYLDALFYLSAMDLYSGRIVSASEHIDSMLMFMKRSAINTYPNNDRLETLRGELYLELGDFLSAEEHFQKANSIANKKYADELGKSSPDTAYITSIARRIAVNTSNIAFARANSTGDKSILNECILLFDSAEAYIDSFLLDHKTYKEPNEFKVFRAYNYLYKAFTYIKMYEQGVDQLAYINLAESLILRARTVAKEIDSRRVDILTLQYLVDVKLNTEEFKSALGILENITESDLFPKVFALHAPELSSSQSKAMIQEIAKGNELSENDLQTYNRLLVLATEVNREKESYLERKGRDLHTLEMARDSLDIKLYKMEEKSDDFKKMGIIYTIALIFVWLVFLLDSRRRIRKVKQESKFLEMLHDLLRFLIGLATNAPNTDSFIAETVNESFHVVKQNMDIDVFLIGFFNPKRNGLDVYVREMRKKEIVSPQTPIFFSIGEENRLPIRTFKKQEVMLEGDYQKNFSKWVDELLPSKKGEHSSSIIYIPIGYKSEISSPGIISVQSKRKNAYTKDHLSLLGALGETVAVAHSNLMALDKLTKSKNALEEVNAKLLNEKEHIQSLQREISHRVKNHLSALAVTIDQQLDSAKVRSNPPTIEALSETRSRVNAVLLVHNHLDQKGDREDRNWLAPQNYFEDLAAYLFEKSLGYTKDQIEIDIQLADVKPLHFELVKDLGIVITELSLNVFEHAYRERAKNEHWIKLEAKINADAELQFIVSDRGNGFAKQEFDLAAGFGFRLIKTIIFKRYKGCITIKYFDEEQQIGTSFLATVPI